MHSGSTHKRPNFRGNRKLYQGGAFLCMISGILVLGFGEGLAQDVRDKESLGLLYQDAVQYREILVPYTTSVPEDPTPRTGRSDPSTILLYCTILPPVQAKSSAHTLFLIRSTCPPTRPAPPPPGSHVT